MYWAYNCWEGQKLIAISVLPRKVCILKLFPYNIHCKVIWGNVNLTTTEVNGLKDPSILHRQIGSNDFTPESCHLYASGPTVKGHVRRSQRGILPLGVSYPFIMREGSSVSTQAAELTKRFSGGRAGFFPATFLETTIITYGHSNNNNSNNNPHVMVQQAPWPQPISSHASETMLVCFKGRVILTVLLFLI